MIKWLFKYGVVILLLNTVLLSIESTDLIGDWIFLGLMALYAIALFINPYQVKNIILHKAFAFFLILNGLNIFYFLLFHSFEDVKAIEYLLARIVQFAIISFSVVYNYDYFKRDFLKHLVYVILGIIILGLIIDPFIFSGRYRGIIWNPNMFSSFTTMAFAALFLGKVRTKFNIISLGLLFVVSLASGSRSVLVAFLLVFLFKYGFSKRNFVYGFSFLLFCMLVIGYQIDTSVNRFFSQSLLNDRILQYQYAYETIMQKPFFGFGLDKYAYINPAIIPDYLRTHIISAHNGYLAIFTQYGLIFGVIIISIILNKVIQLYIKGDNKDPQLLFYFYIIFYIPIAAIYETFFTGINEFQTILFWLALAFLSFTIFIKQNEG